ncbi:spore germination protein [Bacillus clarus]|uniref:GerA spore germination family protein n=1 Tax=Bacillus clarus TaxID=2338372 RepID=A0A090YVT0_9BACI|nr:spore germination protein [Bacillus clarus]KFN02510.1 GerA spore germination family protein [Bacillus clarus]RFT65608.1 spore germination protein [Bacillus clarus]
MSNHKQTATTTSESIQSVIRAFKESGDFIQFSYPQMPQSFVISYFTSLVDSEILHRDILPFLSKSTYSSLKEIQAALPIEDIIITNNLEKIKSKLLMGYIIIQFNQEDETCVLIQAGANQTRSITIPEEEFSVTGPKESFVETLETNLYLVRKRLPTPQLHVKELSVGTLSKTKIAVLYIEGVANEENVHTVLQRISDIQCHQILDSSYIEGMISDNNNSIFPQLLNTERPDHAAGVLGEGKIVVLVDGSPHALVGPTTLVEFFSAFEDYFINWQVASFFRIIRLFGVLFSILATPLYVAILSHHYLIVPKDLISTLVISRSTIPLLPISEAIILELTIDILREAGARLPAKVGQTIGIVGGIVIGTASVEAGITSNALLIIIALSALASFTTPVYKMGIAIRLIRYPFLFFAGLWGLLGIVIVAIFFMVHLLRLTSLGRPYLEPIYPLRLHELKDALIRLPLSAQTNRSVELQSSDSVRFQHKSAKTKEDFDE